MGAIQAYHWAALFPDLVERAIVVCGSARTATHNKVMLSGLLRTLEAAQQYEGNGRFSAEPVAALRAFADPSVDFGLRFQGPEDSGSELSAPEASQEQPQPVAGAVDSEGSEPLPQAASNVIAFGARRRRDSGQA